MILRKKTFSRFGIVSENFDGSMIIYYQLTVRLRKLKFGWKVKLINRNLYVKFQFTNYNNSTTSHLKNRLLFLSEIFSAKHMLGFTSEGGQLARISHFGTRVWFPKSEHIPSDIYIISIIHSIPDLVNDDLLWFFTSLFAEFQLI